MQTFGSSRNSSFSGESVQSSPTSGDGTHKRRKDKKVLSPKRGVCCSAELGDDEPQPEH